MKTYVLDGTRFRDLEEFYVEFGAIFPGTGGGGNLDALNDILRGGFGTPSDGFRILWKNSDLSRERLGYQETVRQLTKRLSRCNAANRCVIEAQIEQARREVGHTVFDWLVAIIRDHSPNGSEPESKVELMLE
ncbi:MAG: barstar family protein [Pikeienuella sp.]